MSEVQIPNMTGLAEAVRQARSGPAQAVRAGLKGADEGAALSLEQRKQALAEKINSLGTITGKEANAALGKPPIMRNGPEGAGPTLTPTGPFDETRQLGAPAVSALGLLGTREKTAEVAGQKVGIAQQDADTRRLAAEAKAADETHENTRQDRLEQNHATRMMKIVSLRSGGLGLQDAKVNQAIDLRTMANQNYNPQTGAFEIPPSMHAELVLGLARLLAPTGQISYEQTKDLQQKTAKEGLAKMYIYLTGKPIAGPTADVAKLFIHTIDRQGETSEKLRDHYLEGIKSMRPTGLAQERADAVERTALGSSFRDLLAQSPDLAGRAPADAGVSPTPPAGQGQMVTIRASDGSTHQLPAQNLDKAKQRDPGLQVIQ
jgi:hypothetical protein